MRHARWSEDPDFWRPDDPGLVEQLVASVLDVRKQPDRSLSDTIIESIGGQNLLIVLDNCEHVIEASARLVDCLLRAVPDLKILATSRVPLSIIGEVIYPVLPLGLPEAEQEVSPQDLMQSEAGQLFFDRGASILTTFRITEGNASAVAYICQHLDGIPLAIELAATRLRHLSPGQIASRLGDRFLLLTGGSRTALPRQQTLRAALDWSYDLLTEAESRLFSSLSVFTGRFSLEAAEAVCSDENDTESSEHPIHRSQVLDLLSALVDHSLVSVREMQAEIRYVLLETVREYALEKLQELGELQTLRDRHMRYYAEFAQQGYPHLHRGHPEWMSRFEVEYDNLRSAMDYAMANHLESALRFMYPLSWFGQFTSLGKDLNGWVKRILDLSEAWPRGEVQAKALFFAGDFATMDRDFLHAQSLLEASLEIAREIDSKEIVKDVFQSFTSMKWRERNWESMHAYAQQHLAISLELGDNLGMGDAFWQLGESASQSGDRKKGREYFEQSLRLARQEDDMNLLAFNLNSLAKLARQNEDTTAAKSYYIEKSNLQTGARFHLANAWLDLGEVLLQEGDFRQAREMARKSMLVFQSYKMKRRQIICLELFAGAAGLAGKVECAARLFGASEAAAEVQAQSIDFDRLIYNPIIAGVRERLGEADFQAQWEVGRKMTLDQSVAYAMQSE